MTSCKVEGLGIGLRFDHFSTILSDLPPTPWFEIIAEDFLEEGPHHHHLLKLREHRPIIFHSVALNLAGVDPINPAYLKAMRSLHQKFEPAHISDHLCWSSYAGAYHHDLLPFPRTTQALQNACERIDAVQSYFQRPIAIENITSYVDFKDNDYTEVDFLTSIQQKTGCFLLLDISNTVINHKNRDEDILHTVRAFPLQHVLYIHLSGGSHDNHIIMDTHATEVAQEDIDILKHIYRQGHRLPAMIERDQDVPAFTVLEAERRNIEKQLS